MSTRFSQFYVVLAPEPASFLRENAVTVVILLRVLVNYSSSLNVLWVDSPWGRRPNRAIDVEAI